MAYGVTRTGFAIKRQPEIKADLEQAAKRIFGDGLIVSAQSPMGQFIGLASDMIAACWETALDTYQSFDVDQAEGTRLASIAKLRLLQKADGETETDFRRAITNIDRARIDTADIVRAIQSLDGVSYAKVFVNDGDGPDEHGIPGHAVALAVIGGENDAIARTLRQYVVPGISTYGTTFAETAIDGFCRTMRFMRPKPVAFWLEISIRAYHDKNDCPPPAPGAIAAGFLADIQGDRRPGNGEDVTPFLIRSIIESRYPNVEFISARIGTEEDALGPLPFPIAFGEIAAFPAEQLTVLSV